MVLENSYTMNKSVAIRLIRAFEEAGIITLANMLGSYDQWRESQEHYYHLVLDVLQQEA